VVRRQARNDAGELAKSCVFVTIPLDGLEQQNLDLHDLAKACGVDFIDTNSTGKF
jgi:hypothetical protein